MPSKPSLAGQCGRALHQLLTRLYAVDSALLRLLLEEQVVEDEAQIGFAGAVIGKRQIGLALQHFLEQRLDELEQVVDLLELAAAVLVEFAVARENMQLLQQLDRLSGTNIVFFGRCFYGRFLAIAHISNAVESRRAGCLVRPAGNR